MKVAFFTSSYSNIKSGPGRLVEYLKQYSGNKISFTFYTEGLIAEPSEVKAKVKKIPVICNFPGYWLIRSYLFYKAFRKASENFDLILCSNAFEAFFLVLFIKSMPVIAMVNDDNYIFTKNNFWTTLKINSFRKTLSRYLGFYIEKLVAGKALKVIACSDYLKKALIKSYQLEETKVKVLYPSVDSDFFTPQKRNYFQGHEINILFVKNDWRRGGLDTIIEGLSKYKGQKSFHLHIAGTEAKDKTIIIKLVNKIGFKGELSFYGILDKEELLNRFYKADVFMLLSRQEAFGISILEALATATPVIAADVGGIPEALDGGKAGFLIAPDSPHELIFVLNNLIQNPDLIFPKIEHGLNYCKKFSKNHLYSDLENLISAFK